MTRPPALPVAITAALHLLLAVAQGADEDSGKIDFNRQIRPILSDKCFQCHGPDEETRKAGLRLDLRESALAEEAIVPLQPEESELLVRLFTEDRDEIMPPPKVKKPVTEEEAQLLKRWVEQGAEYAGHWAFEPIASEEVPSVEREDWARNGIDAFVLAALEESGIDPSPEADAETLVRRLSLDLIGLLPPPEQVRRFVRHHAQNPDEAVSDLADELLASKHHGERWGRHWLDQARYADSNGYTIDGERVMWPYRDWVIRALNEDLPFDRFTIEQLAGDLLDHPTRAQLVASGFHRNTLINQEGGTDDEQFRNEEVVDRVNTTGAVWLGLTLGCAQCHTHKFDPITQREYYEMFAFFNQGEDVNNTGPTLRVNEGEMLLEDPDPALIAKWEQAKANLAVVNRETAKRQAEWEAALLSGDSGKAAGASWKRIKPLTFFADGGASLRLLEDDSLLAGAGDPKEVYRVRLPAPKEEVSAIRLQLLPHESLPQNGPGRAGNGNIVLTRVEFFRDGKPIAVARAQEDHAQPGFSAAFTIDGDPETGWAINVGKGTPKGVKMNTAHEAHYIFSEPIAAGGAPVVVVLHHEKNANYNIGRFAFDLSPAMPGPIGEDRVLAKVQIDPKKRSGDDRKFLAAEFEKVDVAKREAKQAVTAAERALGLGPEVTMMVMRDLAKPRETFLQIRGDFLRNDIETGPLAPGVPAVFPSLPETKKPMERNRLDLAQWLVRPDHPLTPRVTVNRIWMRYFGKGIVETENDFGTQGSFPTHPALLDWLALRFVEKGWSMKELHKLIVTSATYRQASNFRPGLHAIDPLNHRLARQNRIRVEAEIVRDAALSASGLLAPGIGGPGVMPPQPDGVYAFTQRKVNWVAAKGEDRYRRAIYTRFFRSAPYPLLTTFDSPDFQSVCTARVRSNTPLQSLTLANDEAMFELAQGLGARLMREVEGTDRVSNRERIRRAFVLCFAREPGEKELETVMAFQEKQRDGFRNDPEGAGAVAPAMDTEDFDPATAASWTSVARALMNTDEFITRE